MSAVLFIVASLIKIKDHDGPDNCVPEAYILLNDSSQMNVYMVNLIENYAISRQKITSIFSPTGESFPDVHTARAKRKTTNSKPVNY